MYTWRRFQIISKSSIYFDIWVTILQYLRCKVGDDVARLVPIFLKPLKRLRNKHVILLFSVMTTSTAAVSPALSPRHWTRCEWDCFPPHFTFMSRRWTIALRSPWSCWFLQSISKYLSTFEISFFTHIKDCRLDMYLRKLYHQGHRMYFLTLVG